MDNGRLRQVLEREDVDSIGWSMSKRPTRVFSGKKGQRRDLRTSYIFEQRLTLHKGDSTIEKVEWPIHMPQDITDSQRHLALEEAVMDALAGPIEFLDSLKSFQRAVEHNCLNLCLEPVDISPLQQYDYMSVLGRFLGNMAEFMEFDDHFSNLGIWNYPEIKDRVYSVINVFLQKPELTDHLYFGMPKAVGSKILR